MDNRMTLYHHIVLSGGSTMYPGMPSRLERDIKALYLEKVLKVATCNVQDFSNAVSVFVACFAIISLHCCCICPLALHAKQLMLLAGTFHNVIYSRCSMPPWILTWLAGQQGRTA